MIFTLRSSSMAPNHVHAPQACMRYHAELTEKQMQQYTGLEIPRMVVLERAKQKLQEAPASELIDKVQTGRRTWGEVLLGSPVKPALMP